MNMKLIHVLAIKKAISHWMSNGADLKESASTIIGSARRFNWEVFLASKVQGNSLKFLAGELYPYLTNDHVNEALQRITGIDGSGGSGVKRKW